MISFIPFTSYRETALCLDYKRLGKQRVEACQMLSALVGLSDGWTKHPATKMWAGHEGALAIYTLVLCEAWLDLGYKDTRREFIHELYACDLISKGSSTHPKWWGTPEIHDSHKARLLYKNYSYYLSTICNGDEELAESYMSAYPDYVWPEL